MKQHSIEALIEQIPHLPEAAERVSQTVHEAVLKGGRPTRALADALHGTWLGHPLHPLLTDVTIGAWAMSALFDALALARGSRGAEDAADTLVATGLLSAVPTALTGLADFSAIQKPAAPTAMLHAVLNNVNMALYLMSLYARRRGRRGLGVFLSTLALGLTAAAAWLGGHLVYAQQVGVDHSEAEGPSRWTPVLPADALASGTPKRVEVDGNPVLVYRVGRSTYAIGAVCSHAGGPLEEGEIDGTTVKCPWHDSVFDLRDGSVCHGPATQPQPNYEARVRQGQVEVRLVSR